jgi:hypothetical protein
LTAARFFAGFAAFFAGFRTALLGRTVLGLALPRFALPERLTRVRLGVTRPRRLRAIVLRAGFFPAGFLFRFFLGSSFFEREEDFFFFVARRFFDPYDDIELSSSRPALL